MDRPSSNRKLLILDANGILINRRYEKNLKVEPPPGAYREGNFFVWCRPGLNEFLDYIFQNYDVAVWSSAMKHNLEPVAKQIFGKYYDKLVFIWDQSRCQTLQEAKKKKDDKPLFLKNLSDVWQCKDFKGRYTAKNTLIIDDSDEKMVNNPKSCHLNPGTWKIDETKPNAQPPSLLKLLMSHK